MSGQIPPPGPRFIPLAQAKISQQTLNAIAFGVPTTIVLVEQVFGQVFVQALAQMTKSAPPGDFVEPLIVEKPVTVDDLNTLRQLFFQSKSPVCDPRPGLAYFKAFSRAKREVRAAHLEAAKLEPIEQEKGRYGLDFLWVLRDSLVEDFLTRRKNSS